MKARLDKEERAIERTATTFREVTGPRRRKIEGILARARKTRNINIRISEETVAGLKQRAEREGLPYQTLISSILHKYVNDRLVDQEVVARSLQHLRAFR